MEAEYQALTIGLGRLEAQTARAEEFRNELAGLKQRVRELEQKILQLESESDQVPPRPHGRGYRSDPG
jgi:phage shock protein A